MKDEAAKLVDGQLDLLRRLVSIDSPSNDVEGNAEVVKIVDAELKAVGAEVEHVFDEGVGIHVVGTIRAKSPDAPRIVLSGHLDTVFPRGSVAAHPFRVEGDFAYGLGIADCKGSVAVAIGAVRVSRRSGGCPTRRSASSSRATRSAGRRPDGR